jgi:GH35 family endo-1,4-beta-xylanase
MLTAFQTTCVFELIDDIHKNAGVPYNRLAVGFQSHVTARPYYFPAKADLKANFKRLENLGVDAYVTEIDISLVQNSTADARYQAAIWGDFLDVRILLSFFRMVSADRTDWVNRCVFMQGTVTSL